MPGLKRPGLGEMCQPLIFPFKVHCQFGCVEFFCDIKDGASDVKVAVFEQRIREISTRNSVLFFSTPFKFRLDPMGRLVGSLIFTAIGLMFFTQTSRDEIPRWIFRLVRLLIIEHGFQSICMEDNPGCVDDDHGYWSGIRHDNIGDDLPFFEPASCIEIPTIFIAITNIGKRSCRSPPCIRNGIPVQRQGARL